MLPKDVVDALVTILALTSDMRESLDREDVDPEVRYWDMVAGVENIREVCSKTLALKEEPPATPG